MTNETELVEHYSHGHLLDAIKAGIQAMGKTPETITIDDLAAVDEFHIGGRQATIDLIGQLNLSTDGYVLDVGCGVGGTARFVASTCKCRVTGIDLTPEYVETGEVLSSWVGLDEQVNLHLGSALELPFDAGDFNAAIMLHLGMNIGDKARLLAEVNRVLKPGSIFGVYDIMRTSDDPIDYPVPWAEQEKLSVLGTPEEYRTALQDAGFEIKSERNRRDFAAEFFETMRKKIQSEDGPPPLGLHILFGEDTTIKVQNMVGNVAAGRVAPVEMIVIKAE